MQQKRHLSFNESVAAVRARRNSEAPLWVSETHRTAFLAPSLRERRAHASPSWVSISLRPDAV